MVRSRCAIPNCQLYGSSVHHFPKNKRRRDLWVNFVRLVEPNFIATPSSLLCGGHFERSCFNRNFHMERKFGYYSKKIMLTDEAVPTIHQTEKGCEQYALEGTRRLLPKLSAVSQVPILLLPTVQADPSTASTSIANTWSTRSNELTKQVEDVMSFGGKRKDMDVKTPQCMQKNAGKAIIFSIEQVKKMPPWGLIKYFSTQLKFEDSDLKALGCRMFADTLCSYIITRPTLEECKNGMQVHLQKHVKNCTHEAKKDPQFFAKMKFLSVLINADDNCRPKLPGDVACETSVSSTNQGPVTSASIVNSFLQTELAKSFPSTSKTMKQSDPAKNFPSTCNITQQTVFSINPSSKHQSCFSNISLNLTPVNDEAMTLSATNKISNFAQGSNKFIPILPRPSSVSQSITTNISTRTFLNTEVSNATINQASTPGFIKFDELFNKGPRKYLLAPSRISSRNANENVPGISLILQPLENLVNQTVSVNSQPNDFDPGLPIITKITGSGPSLEENSSRVEEKFGNTSNEVDPQNETSKFTNFCIKKEQINDTLNDRNHSQKSAVEKDSGNVLTKTFEIPSLADLANKALSADLSNSMIHQNDPCASPDTDFLFPGFGEDFDFLSSSPVECDELLSFVEDPKNWIMPEVEIDQTSEADNKSMLRSDHENIIEETTTVNIENKNFNTLKPDEVNSPQKTKIIDKIDQSENERSKNNTNLIENKESFLKILGLQRTTAITPPVGGTLDFSTVPIPRFRTRAQKKNALFERFFLKRKAESQIHMQPISPKVMKKYTAESDNSKPTVSRNLRRRNRSMQKFYLSRLDQSSKAALSCEYKDIKGYNLRRANMLKKRAHNQVNQSIRQPLKTNSTSEEKNVLPHTSVGEVVKLPIDDLLGIYEEERKIREKEERQRIKSEEKKQMRSQEEWTRDEESDEEETQMSDTELFCLLKDQIPKDKVVLRRMQLPQHLLPPGNGPRKIENNIKEFQPFDIVIEGELVQIKSEYLSSDEEFDFDEVSPALSSGDDIWNNYRPKIAVSNSLFNKTESTNHLNKFSLETQSSETEDSEDEFVMESVDEQPMISLLIDESIRLGGYTSESESDEELIVVDDIVGQDLTPKVPKYINEFIEIKSIEADWNYVEKLLEITEEADKIAAPLLSEGEIEILAFYNDHPYAYVEGERRSKMISRMAIPTCDDLSDKTAIPSHVSASEYEVREKALEYLKILRNGENLHNTVTLDNNVVDNLTCMICSKKFTASNSMYYHYRSHAGVKPFKCHICMKSFTRLHSLNYHMMIHENKTRFKCKYCNRGFRHPTHYKEHLNKHTGHEPFFCTICDRRFKTSNSQRRHMRAKHNLRFNENYDRNCITLRQNSAATLQSGPATLASKSPPLPDSPSPPALPLKPFTFPQNKSVKLVLFPKNGISRVGYNGE